MAIVTSWRNSLCWKTTAISSKDGMMQDTFVQFHPYKNFEIHDQGKEAKSTAEGTHLSTFCFCPRFSQMLKVALPAFT
jgi:hypothetical protein